MSTQVTPAPLRANSRRITAFLTDSTLCIGCKACEVACKEWNQLPADGYDWTGLSYDNTLALGASTWRHVKFVEDAPTPGIGGNSGEQRTWEFSSDVCKHCEVSGCLESCPTGALVRTEFGGVFLQPDICNGCGYCVVSCPFGVVQKNEEDGRAFKCTFCLDRQKAGLEPACAKACPTQSIKFGELDELRAEAQRRLLKLSDEGVRDAQVWDPIDTSVKGTHSIFLIRGEPQTYNLPPNPEVPTIYLREGWKAAAIDGLTLLAGVAAAFLVTRRRNGQTAGHGGRV
jgi:formate dehydrogenase iron-sulfur subunit